MSEHRAIEWFVQVEAAAEAAALVIQHDPTARVHAVAGRAEDVAEIEGIFGRLIRRVGNGSGTHLLPFEVCVLGDRPRAIATTGRVVLVLVPKKPEGD